MPEVTLPVVPGMEGCHWTFRKATRDERTRLLQLLLTGRSVAASDAAGWLIDFAGSMNDVLSTAWQIASGKDAPITRRPFDEGAIEITSDVTGLPTPGSQAAEAARKAIFETVKASCRATLAEALEIQAAHSARFMVTEACNRGVVGAEFGKTMAV